MTDITESTDIATLPPATRAVIVLNSAKTETDLRAMVAEAQTITAVEDDTGRKYAHSVGMKLVRARTTIEKTGKTAREDAQAFSKAVIAEQQRLIAISSSEEARVLDLRNAYDAKLEEEARQRAADEANRVNGIRVKIQQIRALPLALAGATVAELADEWKALDDFKADESIFAEFTAEAQQAAEDAVAAIAELHRAAEAREQAAAELEAERARIAEAQRLADEQLAAERAQMAAERAAFQAEKGRMAAELAALRAVQAPAPAPAIIAEAVSVEDLADIHPGGIVRYEDAPPVFVDAAWVDPDAGDEPEVVDMDSAMGALDEPAPADQWTPEQQAELSAQDAAPLEFNQVEPTDFRIRSFALGTADQFDAMASKVVLCGFTAFAGDLQAVANLLRAGEHDVAIADADPLLLAQADRDMLDATVAAIEALEHERVAA